MPETIKGVEEQMLSSSEQQSVEIRLALWVERHNLTVQYAIFYLEAGERIVQVRE